jgi:hypothetical protein
MPVDNFERSKINKRHNLIKAAMIAFFLIIFSSGLKAEAGINYQLGRGLTIGETGLNFGGYATVLAKGLGSTPWSVGLDEFSIFTAWDSGSRLRFFSETEFENVIAVGQRQNVPLGDGQFRLERLFIDYYIDEMLTARLGKILTPIGRWNLIHADPLVWTSTRPVATENLFSEHATGIEFHGVIPVSEQIIEYSLYADYSSELDPSRADAPYTDNGLGLRINYVVSDNLQLGFSFSDFAFLHNPAQRKHLLGFDLAWTYRNFAIDSEIVYLNQEHSAQRNIWQGFFQGVCPLGGHLFAIGRYEFFDQESDRLGQLGVLGLAYRPKPPLILKLEYRLGENNREPAPDGLYSSFSILF